VAPDHSSVLNYSRALKGNREWTRIHTNKRAHAGESSSHAARRRM